jgi:hypothetical protein
MQLLQKRTVATQPFCHIGRWSSLGIEFEVAQEPGLLPAVVFPLKPEEGLNGAPAWLHGARRGFPFAQALSSVKPYDRTWSSIFCEANSLVSMRHSFSQGVM